jgi:thiamine-monophosphate kinase
MPQRSREKKKRESVNELGERRIIETLRKRLEMLPFSPVAFGDDVAAVPIDAERVAVLKTDMLVDRTDVPTGMSLRQAARKAVVMNVSDFAAKGVQPTAALVSLGLPRKLTANDVEEIADGLNVGAREYGAYLVGGDTGEASDIVMAVMLYGTALKSRLMLRSGAKPGDVVAVTGSFGNPAAGLRLLKEDCEVPKQVRGTLLSSVFMPRARLAEGLALAASGAVTSSIDSSDGLAWSLHELSRMSGAGFVIDHVPVAVETERFAELCGVDVLELALNGGEEYELVVTVKRDCWGEAEEAVKSAGGELLRVGRVTRERQIVLAVDGKQQPIKACGWEHFKSKA